VPKGFAIHILSMCIVLYSVHKKIKLEELHTEKGSRFCDIVIKRPNTAIYNHTTPLRQWGFRQCLPFSWKILRDKHCIGLIERVYQGFLSFELHKLCILWNLHQPKRVPTSHFHQPKGFKGVPTSYFSSTQRFSGGAQLSLFQHLLEMGTRLG
jgi:hypothetical protein